jgi:uncharacterized membrane protein
MAYCSACGNQVADGVAVCPKCGKSMAATAPAGATAASATSTSGGLDQKIAGLLSYLFIPAIIFLAMEPYNRNPFIRFHAFQGLFLGLASFVGRIVLIFIPVVGWIILPFYELLIFILAVVGALKAYQGNKWHAPLIGDLAEKQAMTA